MIGVRPELVDVFSTIGRIGRSIGVHLLLSTRRLDTGRIRGPESHLSYRICLRTFSEAESREAIGGPDAFLLPREPGWAYLLAGGPALHFRAATVSRPYRAPPAEHSRDEPDTSHAVVMPFEARTAWQRGLSSSSGSPVTAPPAAFPYSRPPTHHRRPCSRSSSADWCPAPTITRRGSRHGRSGYLRCRRE